MQARGLEMMRKLALIVSFCLGTVAGPASALGLGEIELQSALNEPLRAEIPLFAVRPGQRDLITVRIADTEAFTRAGIARTSILSDIRFAVAPGAAADQAVLQLKTATPVREPFLSMLLEVTWPEGRLIREYTALVDPPGTARAPPSTRSRPADSGFTTRPYAPAGEAPARTTADAGAHEYGPVRADETLWSIAYAQRPSDSITMDQMMLAIYEANPDAFDGSVNRIRAGSMLRIPSAESVRAIDPNQARREVGQQRRRSRAPSAPAREEVAEAPPEVAPPPAEAEPASPPKPKGELRLSPPEGAAPTPAAPQGDTLPAPPPPPIVEEAPAVPPPATGEGAPPATVEPPAPARGTAPIEIRDNSAKALELLAAHAREHSARQAAGEPLATETAPQPAAPAAEAPAPAPAPPPAVTPAPAPAETVPAAPPAEPAPAAPPAATESPFADQPTPATPSSPATPAPPSAPAEPPPPAAAPPRAATPPAPASTADSGALLGALNPLMLGLAAAAVLLIGLAAVKLRQRRRRPAVTLAPIVLSEVEPGAHTFGETLEAPKPAARVADTLQATIPPAARTIETTMQSTMPPERTTQQFMAVSTPQAAATPAPPPAESAAPGGVDPYADALSEVDIHIAYGLYDEAARLLQEPLAKSPERKDLHLKLLEVYFSANLPSEFEAQAKTMRSIVGNDTDPDWQKACIMGQQLCPASPLFATAGAASGAAIGATADMDFSSLLSPAQAQTPPPAAAPTSPPSLDFAGLDLGLDKAAAVKPPPRPAVPPPAPPPSPAPAAPAAEANTLDFNLDDFKLDVPASVSTPPEKAAPADEGLDIDLSDFDVGAPAAPSAAPSAAPAAAAAGGEIDMDDLLTADAVEGAAEQADTRLDLARAYMDMGEPAMAQSLLQEVIAQGTTGQKQEAQELLNRLNAG